MVKYSNLLDLPTVNINIKIIMVRYSNILDLPTVNINIKIIMVRYSNLLDLPTVNINIKIIMVRYSNLLDLPTVNINDSIINIPGNAFHFNQGNSDFFYYFLFLFLLRNEGRSIWGHFYKVFENILNYFFLFLLTHLHPCWP